MEQKNHLAESCLNLSETNAHKIMRNIVKWLLFEVTRFGAILLSSIR